MYVITGVITSSMALSHTLGPSSSVTILPLRNGKFGVPGRQDLRGLLVEVENVKHNEIVEHTFPG
jgi:hypothetical protein